MKPFKKILLILLIIFGAIQFFRPQKNGADGPFPHDISTLYVIPGHVQIILQKACNDCHSNHTMYPWYNNIQPIAGWLENHVAEGKEELNFNEFASYRTGRQYRKLLEIKEQVEKGDMPLTSYTLIHRSAELNEQEKSALFNWVESIRSAMRAKFPADSLVARRPK